MIIHNIFAVNKSIMICILKHQRATSQYKQAGEWDKAADTLAIMADIYRRQVDITTLTIIIITITLAIIADISRRQVDLMAESPI